MEGECNQSSANAIAVAPKRTKGRQKIEMKRIEKQNGLNVTFSKRRNGLFKKAEKLCMLFDTEMAILVLSRAGRLHSWGYPSLGSVIDRYIRRMDERVHEVQEEGREEPPRNQNRDECVHEVQEEGREESPQNQNREELQNSSMGSESNSSEVVVDGKARILVAKGTTPTRDFLAGFL